MPSTATLSPTVPGGDLVRWRRAATSAGGPRVPPIATSLVGLQGRGVVGDEGLAGHGRPDVALRRRPAREVHRLRPHVVIGDGREQVGDHVDAGTAFVVAV